MIHTLKSLGGMAVAPHHLAAQAARDVLQDGGNAIEAMIAAASTIAVVYPHMNAIGGDGFWLIHEPGKPPVAIEACGPSAAMATTDFYSGLQAIPSRGPQAALTVAGTVGGWSRAQEVSHGWGGKLPLNRLLRDSIHHAKQGIVVTRSQSELTAQKLDGLKDAPGFSKTYLDNGSPPQPGYILKQPKLALTLEQLARAGLDDFYRGDLAASMGTELARLGSPLRVSDLNNYRAQYVQPLSVRLSDCSVYNLPPPTQGLSTLMILGLFERLNISQGEGFDYVHGLVEATKRAFRVRDRIVTDPKRMVVDPQDHLSPEFLDHLAADIDANKALPWPDPTQPGDTIWMGVVDGQGRAVSFIQSVYWEFGSGTVLDETGVCWQNRGTSFSLDPLALNTLSPCTKPFHTLNPSLALFDDGRVMPFGTMGGEGQPQTQAAIFTRYARFGSSLQQAVSAPRWLLGRTWGDVSTTLKLEHRFDASLIQSLQEAGHIVECLPEDFSDTMGHAGALVRHPNGVIEGASDPRSDGSVAAL